MVAPVVAAGARAAAGSRAAASANTARAAAAERAAARRVVQADAPRGWYAQGEKKYRIDVIVAMAMVTIAFLFDAAQFIAQFLNILPGLGVAAGWYIAILGQCLFFVWFLLAGVWGGPAGKGMLERIFITLGMTVPEWVPLLQAIPALTVGVIVMIVLSRLEDEKKAQQAPASQQSRSAVARQQVQAAPAEEAPEEEPPQEGPEPQRQSGYDALQQEQLAEEQVRQGGGYRGLRQADIYGRRQRQPGEEETEAA